jgi:outer membrane protein
LGVTLSWPLYEGGLTNAQAAQSTATLAQLEAQRDAVVADVRLGVESALLQLRSAREAVDVAGEALEAAREQLRLAEGRYRAGAGSVLELGDAQVRFTTASAQQVQATFTLATARAQLLAALGR